MNKFFGGIMLIIGTSIGGGMLALPVSTAVGGFLPSLFLLLACWLTMLMGALYILEVNLWLPEHTNLISMARTTLGGPGEVITWFVFFVLLYALLSVYISGGSEITQYWLSLVFHTTVPLALATCIFTVVMGYIVYRGIVWVDFINRGLLSGKMIVCFILIIFLIPYATSEHLLIGHGLRILGATTVIITSFGFATIVPSLRSYFKSDLRKLRLAIIVGSAVPLIFYIAWIAAVQGVLSINDPNGLLAMNTSGNVTTQLTSLLTQTTHSFWIQSLSNFFISVCVLTSFLGVALCMTDFLADGFKMVKAQHPKKIIFGALLPPLILVLFMPGLFIKALSYAGILCVILLVLLPVLMVYSGRYVKKIASGYEVFGGKALLLVLFLLSFVAMGLDIFF